MADQRYILPPPPRPWYQRISADRWFSILAILASVAAAGFTGWYAWDTHGMRLDAQDAAKKQAQDVKLAREAAERSANAAVLLGEGMKKSANAAQQSAELAGKTVAVMQNIAGFAREQLVESQRRFELEQRPWFGFQDEIAGELNVNMGKPTSVTATISYTGKGPATDCQVLSTVKFATELKEIQYPASAKVPSIIDFTGTASLERKWLVTAGIPNSSATGLLRLYHYGTITCLSAVGKTYQQDWCSYYPVLTDGRIDTGDTHGCSEGNVPKRLDVRKH
jgi:hypothetical protein